MFDPPYLDRFEFFACGGSTNLSSTRTSDYQIYPKTSLLSSTQT